VNRTQRFKVRVDDVEHEVEVTLEPDASRAHVLVNGRPYEVMEGPDEVALVRAQSDAAPSTQHAIWLEPGESPRSAHAGGAISSLEVRTAQQAALVEALAESGHAADGSAIIRAPMPGRVVRVLVQPGDDVELDDPVAIVEAMKMENEVRATAPGRVANVGVAAGQTVEPGQPLCEIVPHSEAS
jgi:glutaconyl-CoA/methylmalonyl-CoA decarboxylase subunit gamma